MTVLITGGMGFIGLSTAEAFLNQGERVIATYHKRWRLPKFLEAHVDNGLVFEQVDITVPGALLGTIEKHRVDNIVHLAIHGKAEKDAGNDLRVNIAKLSLLLDAARDGRVRRISLSSINGIVEVSGGPFREDNLVSMDTPISPFAYKKAWEILALNYANMTGLEVINLRLPGVFGPMYASMRNLPSRLCHAAVGNTKPDFSPGFGGVPFADDAQDLAYVKDIALGIVLIQQAHKLEHHTYNLGSGRATSNAEFVDAVKRMEPSFDVALQPGRSASFRHNAYADIGRARSEVGYAPSYDYETGIADYIAWLRQGNPE